MTIIDEPARTDAGADRGDPVEAPPVGVPTAPAAVTTPGPTGLATRAALAALSAGAGIIHIAMVPDHAGEWLPEGIAFAATGWLQIGLAAALLARPSKPVLRAAVAVNLVAMAAWAVTRTAGMPFGPEAGVAATASFVDLTAVALEALLVLGAALVLARPSLGAAPGLAARSAFGVVAAGALVMGTAAITSPSAANHDHGGEAAGGHAHGAEGMAEDHDDGHGANGHGHDEGASGDDLGYSLLMNGAGEGGGHAHDHEPGDAPPLTPEEQAKLDAELAATKSLIARYPTLRDAEAGGYYRQGPYSPGLGVHYSKKGGPSLNRDGKMDPEDMDGPMLIFDGTGPDAKLAGFMYLVFSLDTENPPEGFTGKQDQWHYHTNVCLTTRPDGTVDAPLGADTSAPAELCAKYPNSRLIANTGYMLHVWTVPGYESPEGVFSNLHRNLRCPNGTYYTVPMEEIGNRINLCRDVPSS